VTTRKTVVKPDDPQETDEAVEGEFEPVLELDTLVQKRPTVRLKTPEDRDGQLYEMRVPEELGIEEDQQFRSELREFGQLMAGDKLTSAERKRLVMRLDQLCRKILVAPNEIHELLRDRQRQSVITSFTSALFVEDAAALPDLMATRVLSSTMES
jgi:hypothetical protein